jgi:tetratricopeptide (TPR) repeat protein
MADVRKTIDSIMALVTDGRVADADAACSAALDGAPDDVNLVALMGAVRLVGNDLDSAESFLRQAIELEPAFGRPQEDLGALYLARGDIDGAIRQFRKVIAMTPDSASAMRGLVAALERSGDEDEADAVRDRYMDGLPIETLLAEAEVHCQRTETAEAERICDAVLRRDPEHIGALRLLARAATADERYLVAEGFLKRIVRLAPGDVQPLIELGNFLIERSRFPEAIAQFESAEQQAPETAEAPLSLGNLFSILGQTDNAVSAYERCLALEPDNPSAHVGLGHIRRIQGDQPAAREAYEQSVRIRPEFGTAWWYLASLRGYVLDDGAVATMQAQLSKDRLPVDARVGIHFAMARAAESRDDFAAAWQHYVDGNSTKRQNVRYDPVKTEVEQTNIKKAFSGELIASSSAAPDAEGTPIFIVGMPRSGSTLIEQVLASHSKVEGTGELPYILMMAAGMIEQQPGILHYTELVGEFDQDDLARLGSIYQANALSHRTTGNPYFTDKMPANFAHLGLIRMMLPQAKFIDARRGPMATCVANYRQLFAQGKNQSYDLVELGEYYLGYLSMMDHWDDVLPGQVLRVQYEDVVADLETETRRILEFCSLPFEEACLEFHKSERPVNTASAEQVREPIYQSGINYWKNYEPWLDELREVLAPVL